MFTHVKREQADDEYSFSDAGGVVTDNKVFSSVTERKKSKFDKRKTLMTLGILVAVFLVYKLLGVMFHKQSNSTDTNKDTTMLSQKEPTAEQTDVKTKEVASAKQKQSKRYDDNSDLFEQKERQRLQDIEQHENSVDKALDSVNARLKRLEQSTQLLLSKVEASQKFIQSLQQKEEKRKLAAQHTPKRKLSNYYIKAAIPGRAWLIGEKGDFLTVSQGSKIPDYGRVKTIDPYGGIIKTTSRRRIFFKDTDR